MARGIDGEAHRGALEAGGSTVAVLGCGIDRDYPAAHAELARRIGLRAGDFEIEADRRRSHLQDLVGSGPVETEAVREAIAGYRPAVSFDAPQVDA